MCLTVRKLPTTAKESILIKCVKQLMEVNHNNENRFITPYRDAVVSLDGILKEPDEKTTYSIGEDIHGSHIHAFNYKNPKFNDEYKAYAINVKAYDNNYDELVCKFLYIPDADKSGNQTKIVKKLNKVLEKKEGMTWADILKIFPGNERYFRYGLRYNINVKTRIKDKIMSVNANMKNNVVNWTQMVNETNLTKVDLLNFADGNMTRREFERFGGAARKAVRLLGANELRKRARKAASRLPV